MSRSVDITLVTSNIGRGASAEKDHANIHKVVAGAPGAFFGFQEIDEADAPDEKSFLIDRLGNPVRVSAPSRAAIGDDPPGPTEDTYDFVGLLDPKPWRRATPLAVPSTWSIVKGSVEKTSDGIAGVTPNRVVVTAHCRSVEEPDFPMVVFLNGHYPLPRTPKAEQAWRDCQAAWTAHVHELHAAGFTILTTRDSNHHGAMPKVHPKEVQLLDPDIIDRVSVIPAEPGSPNLVTVKVLGRRIIDTTIDPHNAHVVDLRLTAAD